MAAQPQGGVRMGQPIGPASDAGMTAANQGAGIRAGAQDGVKVFQTSVVSPPTSHQQQTQRRVPSTAAAGGDVPRVYSPGQPQQVAYGPAGRGGVNVANLPSGARVVQQPGGGPPQLRRSDSRSGLLPGQPLQPQYQQQQQYHQQQVFQQQQRNYPPQQGIPNKPPLQIIQPRQLINSQGNTQDNYSVNGPLRAYDPKTQPGQQIRPLNPTGQIVQNRLLQRNPQQLSQQQFVTSGGSEDVVPELLNGGMGTEGSKLQGNKNRSYSVAGPINNNLSKIITEEERRRSIAVISRSDGQQQVSQQVQQKPRLFSIIKGRLHTLDGKPGLIQHQQPYSSLQSPPQNSSRVGELIRKMEQAPETNNMQQGTNGVSDIKPSVVPSAPVKPSSATSNSGVGSSSITQGPVGNTVSTSPTPIGLDFRNLALERNAPSTIMENKYSDPKHSEGVLPSKLEDDKETSSSRSNVKEEDRPLSRVGGAPFHGINSPTPTSLHSKDIETKHADSKLSNVQNDKTPEPLNAEPVTCFKPVSGFNDEIPQDSKLKSEIKSATTTHDKNTSEMNFIKTSEGTKNNETVERLLNGHIDDAMEGTPPDKGDSSDSKTASTSSLREVVKVQGHPDDVSPTMVAIEPLVNGNINGEEHALELLDKEKLGNISTTHVEDKSPTPSKQEPVHGNMGNTISPSLENTVKEEGATSSEESKKEIEAFEKSEHLASSSSISNNLVTSSPIPELIASSSSNDNEDHILTLTSSNKSFDARDEKPTKSPSPIPCHLEGKVESDQKSKASSPKSSPLPSSPLPSSPLLSSPKPEEKVEVKSKGLESLSRPATPVSKSENAVTSMPSATPFPDKLPETPVKSKLAAESKPVVFESSFSESLHFEAKSSDKLETPESLPEPIKESKVSLDDKIISQKFIKSASGALSQNESPEKENTKKIKSDSLKQLSDPSSPKAHSKEEVVSSPESAKENKMDTSRPATPKYISAGAKGEEILTTVGHKSPTLEKNKLSANKEICIETNQVDINSQNGILSPKSSSAKSNKDTNKSAKERSALSGKTKDDQDKFKRPVAKKQSREPSICDTKKDGDHDSGVDESTQGHVLVLGTLPSISRPNFGYVAQFTVRVSAVGRVCQV
uniref:Uncharacterized protein n=1 Tax=Timema tahoe TaxID=61484 RepID=A0A7R9NXZ7_9NEOP|nr:unnamed protein product [Timema tahoe]